MSEAVKHRRYTPVESSQSGLFTGDPVCLWKQEWQGMPEFSNTELRPYAEIKIRVSDETALQDLANRLEQPLNRGTKSTWHPALKKGEVTPSNLVWVDEDSSNSVFCEECAFEIEQEWHHETCSLYSVGKE